MLHSEQKLTYSVLCFIDQTPDRCIIHLCTFIHHTYVFIHQITIMIQKEHLCATQFQFLYMNFSIHYRIQFVTVMQWNRQTDTRMFADHVIFVSKMFITPKSIKNLPITTPTQINAWNIAQAAIIIRQMGKKFGVIKPSMWIICHGSNSQQLQNLVATTHVNTTAWQNIQRCKKQ